MGCAQSKPMCQCFGKKNVPEVYRIPSCTTEATLESLEREILRFKARQKQAARRRSNFSLAKQNTESKQSIQKIQSALKFTTDRNVDVLAKEQLSETEKTKENQNVVQTESANADRKVEGIPSVVPDLVDNVAQTVSAIADKKEEDIPLAVTSLVEEIVQTVTANTEQDAKETYSVVSNLIDEIVHTVSSNADKGVENIPSDVPILLGDVVQEESVNTDEVLEISSAVIAVVDEVVQTVSANADQHVAEEVFLTASFNANECAEDINSAVAVLVEEVVQTVVTITDKVVENVPSTVATVLGDVVQTESVNTDKVLEIPSAVIAVVEEVVQIVSANADQDVAEEVVQTVSADANECADDIHSAVAALVDEVVQTVVTISDKVVEDIPLTVASVLGDVVQTESVNTDKVLKIPSEVIAVVEEVMQTVSANADQDVVEVVQTASTNVNKSAEDIYSDVAVPVEEVAQTVSANVEEDLEDITSVVSNLIDDVLQTVSAIADKKAEDTRSAVAPLVEEVVQTVSAKLEQDVEDIPLIKEVTQSVSANAVKNLGDIPSSVAVPVKEVVKTESDNADHDIEASSFYEDSKLVPGRSKPDVPAIREQKYCRNAEKETQKVNKEVSKTRRPDHTFQAIFQNQVTRRCLDFTQRDMLRHPISRRERLSLVSSVLDDTDVQELVLHPKHDDDETLYQGTHVKKVNQCNVSTQNAHGTDVPSNGMSSSTSLVKENTSPDVTKSDVHELKDIPLSTVLAVKEEASENLCSKYANESKGELKVTTVIASGSNETMVHCKEEEQPSAVQLFDLNKHVVKRRFPDPKFQAIFMNQVTGRCLDFTERDVSMHPLSRRERLSLVSTVLDASDIHELVLHPQHDNDKTLYHGTRVETVYPQPFAKAEQAGEKVKDHSILTKSVPAVQTQKLLIDCSPVSLAKEQSVCRASRKDELIMEFVKTEELPLSASVVIDKELPKLPSCTNRKGARGNSGNQNAAKESSNQLFARMISALPGLPFSGAVKLSKGHTKSPDEYALTNHEQQNQDCRLTISSSDEILQQSSHDTNKRMRGKFKVDYEIETQKIKAAMMEMNKHRELSKLSPISTAFVVKFLRARKFEVDGAVELYHNYMMQRKLYFASDFSPMRNPLKAELLSGRFTILDKREGNGAAIAVFTAQRNSREQNHKVVLSSIYLQLNEALKSPQTQTNGMILLYDFSNTSYLTSDSQLCIKIINLLKDAYPVSLIKTFIISSPFWIESELKFCSKLLRGTNREKILFVSQPGLKNHLSVDCIPQGLGGNLHVNYMSWIDQCILGYSEQLVTEPIIKPRYGNCKG